MSFILVTWLLRPHIKSSFLDFCGVGFLQLSTTMENVIAQLKVSQGLIDIFVGVRIM